MGKGGMNSNSPVTKERAEVNCHIQDGNKETKDGVMGEGRGLPKEDDFRVNEDLQGVHDGRAEQQLQGWEEFLSVRSLKVLLVENDDGTRNILRALLQNCGYEVLEADNGIRAWEIVEDLTTHVDLILSEVVMPSLSGMDLLTKIMDHKTRKNIPVIMMSSQDSMSTVIRCLSMGAVDFLLKPIRKNELKNLWRHIWRKCHRSWNYCFQFGFRLYIQASVHHQSTCRILISIFSFITHPFSNLVVVGVQVISELKNLQSRQVLRSQTRTLAVIVMITSALETLV